jgi:long-chain fatty acid transport protein
MLSARVSRRLAGGLVLCAPLMASATNGYFSHGYGVQSEGVAGVAIALPQDGLAAAANPAGTAFLDNRFDLGLSLFVPKRDAKIVGNAFGADASYSGNGSKVFAIPEVGYVRRLNGDWTFGFAVYGNGGMNTDYSSNPYARFGGTGSAGVNLEQLFITPSLAYRLTPDQAIGVGVNLAYQRFSAKGLNAFASFSAAPDHLTDRGTDTSTGAGVRVGWTGRVTPEVTLGATWASKINGKFDDYRGLFADGGSFDIPANYGVGIAVRATPALTLAADVQRIEYSGVASIANPLANLLAGNPLGSANGPGFGWRDITVVKLGAVHQWSNDLTLRAGISHAQQPVPQTQTFFNILAPGVVQDHLTFGATWKTAPGGELSAFFAHAFGKTVNGAGSIPAGFPPAGFGGGNVNVRLQENIVGIAYGWKL